MFNPSSPNDKLKRTKLVGKQALSRLHLPFNAVPIAKLNVQSKSPPRKLPPLVAFPSDSLALDLVVSCRALNCLQN